MKVQCDVCAAEAASVFCCADEAALCDACDRRVHGANKLAGKHRRFSLLHPGSSSTASSSTSSSSAQAQKPPLCDICQERRGFLFCKEDRAILCRECDAPVHSASEMTRRHSRFLLTGVRLSSAPVDSPGPPDEEDQDDDEDEEEEANSSSPCNGGAGPGAGATTASASDGSSISEYLTKTLPGWHVEDFLVDDASARAVGACSDGFYQEEQVGQTSGLLEEAYTPWTGREQLLVEQWVRRMRPEFAGTKRPRASPPSCPYW